MNNVIMRKVVVGANYTPLTSKSIEIGSVDVSTPPTNSGTVFFKGDDGNDVPWTQGEYHTLKSINLADLRVKGTPGDVVTIIGGTW